MIINSPIGRFPFEATSIRLHGGRVRLEGAMGTWPTSVDVSITELPRIVGRILPRATTVAVAGAAAAVVIAARCRGRRG